MNLKQRLHHLIKCGSLPAHPSLPTSERAVLDARLNAAAAPLGMTHEELRAVVAPADGPALDIAALSGVLTVGGRRVVTR